MDPSFGRSNIYIRVSKATRQFLKRSWIKIRTWRPPKLTLGKVWLRLSYFENKLIKLEEDNQEIFIENFYHSVRQVNYLTLLTIFVIIATYLTTFQFRMIGFWEGFTVEVILVLALFYIVWYYRMGMEDLIDYLHRTETVPDYAFRPRLGHRVERPLVRKLRKRKAVKKKPRKR
jgi:hypothetical protein